MAKNIVICSDGTGNTTVKNRGSNVFKLYEAVALHGSTPQIAFYDDGVGTEKLKPLSLLGGAFGWGLARNVKQLYAELARSYEPDDKIFLFGFSRGAFTVRTLGGFITTCGILKGADYANDAKLVQAVKEAYAAYRKKYFGVDKWRKKWAEFRRQDFDQVVQAKHDEAKKAVKHFHEQHAVYQGVPIEFIGVWDTVAAYGFPVDEIADVLNWFFHYKYTDRSLHPLVRRACQALAIDEERKTFHPLLWDERAEDRSKPPRIEQVWFAGVHSNIGGGYPKQGMSLVALDWMMQQAAARALQFNANAGGPAYLQFNADDRAYFSAHANINDKLYDSRAGLATIYRYDPRNIARLCSDNGVTPKLHLSAVERLARATDGYAPGNLPLDYKLLSTGAAPPYQAQAESVVQSYMRQKGPPFSQATRWVEFGRVSHFYFFVFLMAAILILLIANRPQDVQRAIQDHGYWRLVINVATNTASHYWVALIAFTTVSVILYLCGRYVGRRAADIYSQYWHSIREDLRIFPGSGTNQ